MIHCCCEDGGGTCHIDITVHSCSGAWLADAGTVEFKQGGVVVASSAIGGVGAGHGHAVANVPAGVATTATVNPLRPYASASSTASFAAGIVTAGGSLTGSVDLTVASGYTCICYGPLPNAGLMLTDSYMGITVGLTKINPFQWQGTGTGTTMASVAHPATSVSLTYNLFLGAGPGGVGTACYISVNGSGGVFPDHISGGSTTMLGGGSYISIDPPNVIAGSGALSIYRDAADTPGTSLLTVHL